MKGILKEVDDIAVGFRATFHDLMRGYFQSHSRTGHFCERIIALTFGRFRRAQVHLIKGVIRNLEKAFVIVFLGDRRAAYEFANLACSRVLSLEPLREVPLFQLRSATEILQRFSDLVVVHNSMAIIEGLRRSGFFMLPPLGFQLNLAGSMEQMLGRMSRRRRRDLRKIRCCDYEYSFCKKRKEDLEFFYWKMYLPFIRRRFGEAASCRPYQESRVLYKNRGRIIFVRAGDKILAAMLFQIRKKSLHAMSLAVDQRFGKDGDLGGEAALYYLVNWAKKEKLHYLDYGGCLPFFEDGIFVYKKEWGMRVQEKPEFHGHAVRFTSVQAAQTFVRDNPFIIKDGGSLKGVICVDCEPNRETLRQAFSRYFVPGLESLLVMTPNTDSRRDGSATSDMWLKSKPISRSDLRVSDTYHAGRMVEVKEYDPLVMSFKT